MAVGDPVPAVAFTLAPVTPVTLVRDARALLRRTESLLSIAETAKDESVRSIAATRDAVERLVVELTAGTSPRGAR